MEYTFSNWTALTVYLNDGYLDIDNNEGEMRFVASALDVGTGSSAAATAAASQPRSTSACWLPGASRP